MSPSFPQSVTTDPTQMNVNVSLFLNLKGAWDGEILQELQPGQWAREVLEKLILLRIKCDIATILWAATYEVFDEIGL